MEMSRLTRDGTAVPVSRDQILRHARGQGNIIYLVQLTTSRIGNLRAVLNEDKLNILSSNFKSFGSTNFEMISSL